MVGLFIVAVLQGGFKKPPFLFDLQTELFFRWQAKHVFGGEDLFAIVQHRVAGYGLVLFRAEDEPDGRVVIRSREDPVMHPHITVHLTDIAMGQFANLQVNKEIEFQAAVIENQVDVAVLLLDANMLLPCNEGKSILRPPGAVLMTLRLILFPLGGELEVPKILHPLGGESWTGFERLSRTA